MIMALKKDRLGGFSSTSSLKEDVVRGISIVETVHQSNVFGERSELILFGSQHTCTFVTFWYQYKGNP